MQVEKKLVKIGSSLFILLESSFCKGYNLKENDIVIMRPEGNKIVIEKKNDNR